MKMKELYEKVAADAALQEAFAKILRDTANDADDQGKKLVEFAKKLGYEVTVEEIAEFFTAQSEKSGELAEEDMDAVAGGKRTGGGFDSVGMNRMRGNCGIIIGPVSLATTLKGCYGMV